MTLQERDKQLRAKLLPQILAKDMENVFRMSVEKNNPQLTDSRSRAPVKMIQLQRGLMVSFAMAGRFFGVYSFPQVHLSLLTQCRLRFNLLTYSTLVPCRIS